VGEEDEKEMRRLTTITTHELSAFLARILYFAV